jgi:hypothetical protein
MISTPGMTGLCGKWPGKEGLVDGHILEAHGTLAELDLDDPIHKQEGISMRDVLLDFVDVDDFAHDFFSMSASFFSSSRTRSAIASRRRRWEKFLIQSAWD